VSTPTKTQRPQILTESDQILSELSDELALLKQRMRQLEDDSNENKSIIKEMGFYEEFSHDSYERLLEERTHHKDNYQVLANVMQNLKSPINSVVDNLGSLINDIPDEETRQSLKECMATASSVLDSFTEVEEFCKEEGKDPNLSQADTELRPLFIEFFRQLQAQSAWKRNLRWEIASELPSRAMLYAGPMLSALEAILHELNQAMTQGEIQCSLSLRQGGEKYGLPLQDLNIEILASEGTSVPWLGDWVADLAKNRQKLKKGGLDLLGQRSSLRSLGGKLEVIAQGEQMQGFSILIPLTY